ncbi:FkbM family methyltransferase [Salinimicrobium sp. CAU 1759]
MNFFEKFFKKDRSKLDIVYRIGNHELLLPPDHLLPIFQKKHRLYDRFLPHLVGFLNEGGVVVDVGANVGDTTIAMLQNCNNKIVAIEPSEKFFGYLRRNIETLPPFKKDRIESHKIFIGTGNIKGEFFHTNGTAGIKGDNESKSPQFTTLDKLLKFSSVELLKVDTDGYDYDVLLSAKEILKKSEPILFWENQIDSELQRNGYNHLYEVLRSGGYKHVFIFDNFGNLLLENSNFANVKDLNSYVSVMDRNNSTRTFYYTDILAATDKNFNKVKAAVSKYKFDVHK